MTTGQSSLDAVDRTEGDDLELVARLQRGDDVAAERFVRDNGARLLAMARRYLGNDADAQEAVQEAFLNAFRSLQSFKGDSRLLTWLTRILINICLARLRKREQRGEALIEDLLPRFNGLGHRVLPEPVAREGRSHGVESQETRDIIRRGIERLPESHRTVLFLRDIEQLDTREAAEALGLTETAVKVRLHRARQALRELIERELA
jgi:RNA polymerase sigma-70 factor (ECF subfamily)